MLSALVLELTDLMFFFSEFCIIMVDLNVENINLLLVVSDYHLIRLNLLGKLQSYALYLIFILIPKRLLVSVLLLKSLL